MDVRVIVNMYSLFTEDDLLLDWTLRHGRSAALFVALKEAPEIIYKEDYIEKIHRTLLAYIMADRVSYLFT